jgi:hypothetical protein
MLASSHTMFFSTCKPNYGVFGSHNLVVVPCTFLLGNIHEEKHSSHPFDVKTILLLFP